MARAHSRRPSLAGNGARSSNVPHGPPRITNGGQFCKLSRMIRSTAKAAVSQARTSSRQFLVFLTNFQEYGTNISIRSTAN